MSRKVVIRGMIFIAVMVMFTGSVFAEGLPLAIPNINVGVGTASTPTEYVNSIQLLMLLTVLTLVPSFLVMITSFTRIIVVLGFLRNALGTQQTPPNQVLLGLALFLTLFIMSPIYVSVMDDAVKPYLAGEITQQEAIATGSEPIKNFMLNQTREKDLQLFVDISGKDAPQERLDTSFTVLIPSFIISELKTAFQMGFLLFMPFIVIDMVVASILMAMGMFMLPPTMIALPFKLLLFVMVDGWYLIVQSMVQSFT